MRVRRAVLALSVAMMPAAPAPAQTGFTPPRLVSAAVPASPMGAQSGGIAAFDVTLDERGSVAGVEAVQDFAPFGDVLREAVRGWTFEPARDQGRAVRSRVLVLGFFRPPELAVIAPPRPRYKDTVAPPELPWPTSITVPPYPPNALGSGKVVLEVEVSEEGKVVEHAGPQSRRRRSTRRPPEPPRPGSSGRRAATAAPPPRAPSSSSRSSERRASAQAGPGSRPRAALRSWG